MRLLFHWGRGESGFPPGIITNTSAGCSSNFHESCFVCFSNHTVEYPLPANAEDMGLTPSPCATTTEACLPILQMRIQGQKGLIANPEFPDHTSANINECRLCDAKPSKNSFRSSFPSSNEYCSRWRQERHITKKL